MYTFSLTAIVIVRVTNFSGHSTLSRTENVREEKSKKKLQQTRHRYCVSKTRRGAESVKFNENRDNTVNV